jgi:hypothetical protein
MLSMPRIAVVSWNTLGTGYKFQYMLLEAHNGNANIYALPSSHLPVGMGYVVIDNFSNITAVFCAVTIVAIFLYAGRTLISSDHAATRVAKAPRRPTAASVAFLKY